MSDIFLTAEWRKLIMANYAVDPAVLKPYLPYKTELDFRNNSCYVSLVGFMFTHVKIKGISIPFHTRFEEVNLRFYVRYKDGQHWKRGAVFISEIVPLPAISLVANTLYGEKYRTMAMRHRWEQQEGFQTIAYQWRYKRNWFSMEVKAGKQAGEMAVGSGEEFILEHYWGYTQRGAKKSGEYGVEHPRWQVYPVLDYAIEAEFGALYGPAFANINPKKPDSVFLAEGSPVSIKQGATIL
jgi:uncharacterized protein YqjF (DUF2071 family)